MDFDSVSDGVLVCAVCWAHSEWGSWIPSVLDIAFSDCSHVDGLQTLRAATIYRGYLDSFQISRQKNSAPSCFMCLLHFRFRCRGCFRNAWTCVLSSWRRPCSQSTTQVGCASYTVSCRGNEALCSHQWSSGWRSRSTGPFKGRNSWRKWELTALGSWRWGCVTTSHSHGSHAFSLSPPSYVGWVWPCFILSYSITWEH